VRKGELRSPDTRRRRSSTGRLLRLHHRLRPIIGLTIADATNLMAVERDFKIVRTVERLNRIIHE
jgi:hypothetical protein